LPALIRDPQDKLENTSLYVELTSDAEWVPHTFALPLAEEDELNSDDEAKIMHGS
jgi:hypothetical protein